jgi:C4-dicarboxylate transporter DctQ subunit
MIIAAMSLGAIFTGVIAFFGARWVIFIYGTGQTSPDLEWPMWVIYLAIPFGSGLMCYRFIQAIMLFLKTGHVHTHTYGEEDDREVDVIHEKGVLP